jgi:general secretion pathway protein G
MTLAPMKARAHIGGFTLLELVTATAIGGLLLSIAIPSYIQYVQRLKVNQAEQDLMTIGVALERYRNAHDFKLPDALDAMSGLPAADPWGHPYAYLNFAAPIPGINGMIRKDHNLHPLNTDFDLYSLGADGRSASPLTARASQDDVIWARDGSFVGLASDF